LSAFGSQTVFGVGLLTACGMTLCALGVLREARALPEARPADSA
jgi:ATP:ADP antiporter, AAA family